MIKQQFEAIPPVKILINIGCLMDIPTGSFIKGLRGENILLGGLGALTGVSGNGNLGKSTILHNMTLSAFNRIMSTTDSSLSTYDTEINVHEGRLDKLLERFEYLKDRNVIETGEWIVTDKSIYYGDKWFEVLKDFLKEKRANAKQNTVDTPFLSRDKTTPMKILVPTFSEIDSLTDFTTSDVTKMQNENELGESGRNTINMRAGLAKYGFMQEAPVLGASSMHFFLFTAQEGMESTISTGPMSAPPPKKLQHMKQGQTFKGVTGKFFFSLNNSWQTVKSTLLINQSTKSAEYPRDSFDNGSADTDLNLVSLKQLRSKSGRSGYVLDLVFSQDEGVLPSLTEFHYIKEYDRFGLEGSLQNYSLDLLPEVKLSRTTIRSKIDENAELRRALNITSELCQMHHFYRHMKDILMTPKELYEGVKKQGYDWKMILNETRGWWAVNDEKHPLKFLSTMDLVLIARGEYTPYWK